MNSPPRHGVSNTMTKRKTNRKRVKASSTKRSHATELAIADRMAKLELKKTRMSHASNAGMAIGGALGSLTPLGPLGAVLGSAAGGLLGSGIASLIGEGQYKIVGPRSSYNVLSGNQIPKFSTSRATNIVCHREYLQDVYGTSSFTNQTFPINPGVAQTFPWLSNIAANYQEYRFHGVMFEFRALTTDYANSGVPGVVVMATNYNSDNVAYANKQQMENSEYATSIKPTMNLAHFVECAAKETFSPIKFTRSGSPPSGQDLRLYDQGLFQLATQGSSASVNLGELWITYCVEFFKPILSPSEIPEQSPFAHFVNTGVTTAAPFGAVITTPYNSLGCGITTTGQIRLPTLPAGTKFQIIIGYNAGTSVASPTIAYTTNCAAYNAVYMNTSATSTGPYMNAGNGTTSDLTIWYATVTLTGTSVLTFGATVTGTTFNEVIVSLLPFDFQ